MLSSDEPKTARARRAAHLRRTPPCLPRCVPRRVPPNRGSRSGGSGYPERQELAPVRLLALLEVGAQQRAFFAVALGRERAAHHLEAQVEKVGVGDVGLAIVADRGDGAGAV